MKTIIKNLPIIETVFITGKSIIVYSGSTGRDNYYNCHRISLTTFNLMRKKYTLTLAQYVDVDLRVTGECFDFLLNVTTKEKPTGQ